MAAIEIHCDDSPDSPDSQSFNPLLMKMKNEYPKAFKAVANQLQGDSSSQLSLPDAHNQELADHFECIIDVIDDVVDELNVTDNWPETKEELSPLMENLANCTNLG